MPSINLSKNDVTKALQNYMASDLGITAEVSDTVINPAKANSELSATVYIGGETAPVVVKQTRKKKDDSESSEEIDSASGDNKDFFPPKN